MCKCICGNEVVALSDNLKRGYTKSCGCTRYEVEDLVDKRFGKLVVTGRSGSDKHNYSTWECKCDCGNSTVVKAVLLKKGETKSCGCLQREVAKELNKLPYGEAAFNRLLLTYVKNARTRNLEFLIDIDEFKQIITSNCYYCGVEPLQKVSGRSLNGNILFNGIDRVDNSKGYIKDNVVPCCKQCNQSKMNLSKDKFLEWAKRLVNYQNL